MQLDCFLIIDGCIGSVHKYEQQNKLVLVLLHVKGHAQVHKPSLGVVHCYIGNNTYKRYRICQVKFFSVGFTTPPPQMNKLCWQNLFCWTEWLYPDEGRDAVEERHRNHSIVEN